MEATGEHTSGFGGRLVNRLSRMGWITFTLLCIVFFTFIKLPSFQVGEMIQGRINQELAKNGVYLQSQESHFSILTGFRYQLEKVNLSIPRDGIDLQLDELTIRPQILSLFSGKMGASVFLRKGLGEIDLDVAMKNPDFDVAFDSKDLNLGDLGILESMANLQASAILSGKGSLKGNTKDFTKLTGEVDIKLNKISLPEQRLPAMFNISLPQLFVSGAKIQADITDSQVKLKSFQIGKDGSKTDDFTGSISGVITLGRTLRSSRHQLKANFRLSEKIKGISGLIESLLRQAKRSDGSYSYDITGPFFAPFPKPSR